MRISAPFQYEDVFGAKAGEKCPRRSPFLVVGCQEGVFWGHPCHPGWVIWGRFWYRQCEAQGDERELEGFRKRGNTVPLH